jgi:hypothetical protein
MKDPGETVTPPTPTLIKNAHWAGVASAPRMVTPLKPIMASGRKMKRRFFSS